MFSLPSVIKSGIGKVEFSQGTLFRLPAELSDNPRIASYGRIAVPGWGVSEFGYSYFARRLPGGELLILPGLIVEGGPKPKKKVAGHNLTFTRAQVELYAESIVDFENQLSSKVATDLNMLVHDLRSLSTTLYNAAEEARSFTENNNPHEALQRIKNVIAAQTILRIRIDLLDFAGNPSAQIKRVDVPIYNKVVKVVRCMKPRAAELGINLQLLGTSYKSGFGPNVFEVVPYILIDNALKYSERGLAVDLEIEDREDAVVLRVLSDGPPLTQDEMREIFCRGFRGAAAIATGKQGSGLGLFLAVRMLREHFGGEITVSQGGMLSSKKLVPTEFTVTIPVRKS